MRNRAARNVVSLVVLVALVAAVLPLSSCKTLSGQEMAYLGDDSAKPNVSGRGVHGDWLGIGVGANTYIQEYERAILAAKGNDPSRNLTNIKAFKEYKSWPQFLGIAMSLAGGIVAAGGIAFGDSSTIAIAGSALSVGGAILCGYRTYDYWVIGELSD